VLKFPIFRYHGNKGQCAKKSFSAPYVEAMFQIWWRSVHKSHHNRGRRCRRQDTATDFIFCPMLYAVRIALDRQQTKAQLKKKHKQTSQLTPV